MQLRQVVPFQGQAPKVGKRGVLTYQLYVDSRGILLVQIIDNDNPGSFPRLAFEAERYFQDPPRSKSTLDGYDVESGELKTTNDYNAAAFLRAVLTHLFERSRALESE